MPKQQLGVEFFLQRPSIYWYQRQLKSARDIWAAWLIGGSIHNYKYVKNGKFRRLILLHPDCIATKIIPELQLPYKVKVEELQRIIRDLTTEAQQSNCEVKWCKDMTYNLLTIGNPPDQDLSIPDDMWVICELWLPGIDAPSRPSFKAEHIRQRDLTDNILKSFNELWKHSVDPTQ